METERKCDSSSKKQLDRILVVYDLARHGLFALGKSTRLSKAEVKLQMRQYFLNRIIPYVDFLLDNVRA